MTDVWRAFAPGSETGSQIGGSAARSVAFAACVLGVAALCGAALVPGSVASADPVSGLQAQAAQLSREMLYEQLQITGYQQQHSADLAAVAADENQVAASQSKIAAVRTTVQKDVATLKRAAVKAYVEGGAGVAGGTTALFTAGSSQGASVVYDQVMTGNLTTALGRLQSDRRTLQADLAAQQNILAAAQKSETAAASALADAQSTAQTLANQHAAVTGQLAAAVAQQQAAQAAAARAAALAAMRAATPPPAPAPSPVPTTASSSSTTASSSSTALPVLPPFLRCVIQAESGGNYQAVSPTGGFMGAFQFSQSTWNVAAQLAGMPTLIGVPPNQASAYDQDLLAIALYRADGEQPWYDPCRN